MHTFDIAFIVAGVVFVILGVRRGLIGEIFRCAALLGGFLAAFLFQPQAIRYTSFLPAPASGTLAFIALFGITAMIILAIGWIVRKLIHLTPLGWADYLFGGAAGLAKTVLLFWMVCLALSTLPINTAGLGLQHSMVFQTYKSLPVSFKLHGLTQLRHSLGIPPTDKLPQPRIHKGLKNGADSAENVI